ncbi:hypothetical protein G6F55_003033 [Rhizopus delemar]|uniref:non-specific serine/threonine protein kinase n=2 Tax=Rhizopus TaxID=4842 RepID=A0A9P6ZEI1_9FUNG|nr:hypothetical protein G6F55_003033 [Rhizopus delemar]KAG1553110.1 hypothetical protein G6F51_000801 [Rhizopus arrhizus]KAG1500249.1 hypothetical protein G6F54_003840 [Rhizopus delemar]KAG1519089.1 hypothetical protein G6F53_000039 [Rhizopus delemar]KAG1526217.1 hypothetical protein G6F52_002626 [Rhizopus delemar]
MIQSSSRRKTLPSYFYTLSLRHPSSSSTLISSSDSLSSSGSSSSSIGTNSTLIPSEQDEDEEYEDEEIYVPHLHNRLKQQPKQAILTTLDDFKIIITNSTASDVLVGHENYQQDQLIGKQVIMDLIDPSYQNRLNSIIVKQRKTVMQKSNDSINADDGTVIICGDIIPIIKLDGTKSSTSLWLKEKKNEAGVSVFIWIFEAVYESTVTLQVNEKAVICSVLDEDGLKDLYGYDAADILNAPLTKLIPLLSLVNWKDDIRQLRFFGSETIKGARFPIIVRLLNNDSTVQITSIPVISGLVNVRRDGVIEGCDQSFIKYLFGYCQDELVLQKNVADLLPQFPTLFHNLKRDDLLQQGFVINNAICRKLVDQFNFDSDRSRLLTLMPNNQPLPLLIGLHRDGSPFEIQLQLKLMEEKESYALWISFDRELTFKRYGHQHLISFSRLPNQLFTPTKRKTKNETLYSAQKLNAVRIEDYVILSELGQGAYGLVKIATKKDDPEQKKVVIKYVIKSRILVECWTRDQVLGNIPTEIHILHTLKKIPHKNISDMLDYFEDDDHYYIVMEYHETMDLFDYIEYNERVDESNVRKIFKQLALAVQHLHDHRIVHRDIKDENVVLDKELNVQLIDFGSAAYLKHCKKYENFVGTLDYAAPEILKGQTYSGKPQDVWALGILLFTLIYRENPFYDIDEIMSRELRIPFVLSNDSVDLIRKMLERDVEKRIDIHKVLVHPWLKN